MVESFITPDADADEPGDGKEDADYSTD